MDPMENFEAKFQERGPQDSYNQISQLSAETGSSPQEGNSGTVQGNSLQNGAPLSYYQLTLTAAEDQGHWMFTCRT